MTNETESRAGSQSLMDQLCRRFTQRWRDGEAPLVEEFLQQVDPRQKFDALKMLLKVELAERIQQGDDPLSEEYRRRFPGFEKAVDAAYEAAVATRTPLNTTYGNRNLEASSGASEAPLAFPSFPYSFGRYQVLKSIGRGGMGSVYLAHDTLLDRQVALKIPHSPAGRSKEHDEEYIERFYREARAAAALRHPNICAVYDVGQIGGVHHIAMAFIDGRPLSQVITPDHPAPQQKAARWVRLLAEALEQAHRQGVIHRDLKPSNIMIDPSGQPILMDFGLARRSGGRDPRLTLTGAVMGTPAYMAPEQFLGAIQQIGPATDIYGLGAALYQLLTGRLPYVGESSQVIAMILKGPPPPPSVHRSDLDSRLEAICIKAMAHAPQHRFASMEQFAQALDAYLRAPQESAWSSATANQAAITHEAATVFRQWGWSMGIHEIRNLADSTEDRARAKELAKLSAWLKDPSTVDPNSAARWGATELGAWRDVGEAFEAIRRRDYQTVEQNLRQVEQAGFDDPILSASVSHCRGTMLHHRGKADRALACLHRALEQTGRGHFLRGRILDTLGKTYAAANNYEAAREFYEQAIVAKKTHQDTRGLAVTHGQLGRLHLDWGNLEAAEKHFRIDLELAEQLGNSRAAALMYNHLGQVYLAKGMPDEALGYLDESLHIDIENDYRIEEAFARKDLALALLRLDQIEDAEKEIAWAAQTFTQRKFDEGMAHVQRVQATLLSSRADHRAAEQLLRESASWFDQSQEAPEAARSYLELARVRQARRAPRRLVADALLKALERAERSARDALVREVEQELAAVDPAEHSRHAYRRARGREISEDTTSLRTAVSETATILQFELADYSRRLPADNPVTLMATLNQVYAELTPVMERHHLVVHQFLGEGFMALSRSGRHAVRAVECALDLIARVEELNRPRRVLALPEFRARIAVNSGAVVIGNVGTYRKIDFTAVGHTARLAARILYEARPIAVSQATYELSSSEFVFAQEEPRLARIPDLGEEPIWDVVKRRHHDESATVTNWHDG